MAITSEQVQAAAARWDLSQALSRTGGAAEKLATYGNLLMAWNVRLSLTSIRDEAQVIERHLMEGVFAAAHHPAGTAVLDFGSGTGVPGVPIAICRPNLVVTLAESQRKKAAFLHEVIRTVGLQALAYAGRAETLPTRSFEAVWMRAVDKSAAMLSAAAELVTETGWLCLLGTGVAPSLTQWRWKTIPLPGSTGRVLHICQRASRSTWNL